FFVVATAAWLVWSVMNWILSVASIFVVTRNADTLGAIGDAVGVVREHFGAVLAVSTWFGLAHVVAISVASSAVAFPMAFAGLLRGRLIFLAILLIAMLYFAVVDLLYLGRLGSYMWIVEGPEIEPEPLIVPSPPATIYLGPSDDRVDPDDLILSDIPV